MTEEGEKNIEIGSRLRVTSNFDEIEWAEYTRTRETHRTREARADFLISCMARVFRPLSCVTEIGEYS